MEENKAPYRLQAEGQEVHHLLGITTEGTEDGGLAQIWVVRGSREGAASVALSCLDCLDCWFLAGWLANPQGSWVPAGGKSLAGSVGVAGGGTLLLEIPADGQAPPLPPWRSSPGPPVEPKQQRPCRVHIKCRNGQPMAGSIGQWEGQGRVGCGRERQDERGSPM